jgi:CRP-like cAMP-binding protein
LSPAESTGNDAVAEALCRMRLLRRASPAGVATLASRSTLRVFARGEVIVEQGAPATGGGVLVSGRLSVYHLGPDGRRLVFETAGPDEPVALVAALAGSRYPAWIEAMRPSTVAWFDREALYGLMDAEPAVSRSIVADLADRVVAFSSVATALSLDVPARVARFVFQRSLAVGTPSPDGLVVDLGVTKTELAASLGTVPETLSRALARLKDEGLLDVRGRRVLVLDVGGLARRGEGYA